MSRIGKLFQIAAAAVAMGVSAEVAFSQDVTPAGGHRAQPAPVAPCPVIPYTPTTPGTTPTTPGTTPTADPLLEPTPSFGSAQSGAGAGEAIALGGYIDNARPVTMFRLRADAAYRNNRPDRAEFFYPKCGCFGTPDAKGPGMGVGSETNVDYQEILPYFEYAINPNLSVFVTVPVRFINPTVNANSVGLSDVSFGAKYAFINTADRAYSFQLMLTTPSGDGDKGLGQENWRLEPGVLFLEQLRCRWGVFGEFKDSINLTRSSDFTGNVLRYGLGTSYAVVQSDRGYIAPVGELVGWTVLSGKELRTGMTPAVVAASGDTIVNAKVGVRFGWGGPTADAQLPTGSDIYIGYGRALTGEVWYKDMLRVEYRKVF
jgi:hypothetical protein